MRRTAGLALSRMRGEAAAVDLFSMFSTASCQQHTPGIPVGTPPQDRSNPGHKRAGVSGGGAISAEGGPLAGVAVAGGGGGADHGDSGRQLEQGRNARNCKMYSRKGSVKPVAAAAAAGVHDEGVAQQLHSQQKRQQQQGAPFWQPKTPQQQQQQQQRRDGRAAAAGTPVSDTPSPAAAAQRETYWDRLTLNPSQVFDATDDGFPPATSQEHAGPPQNAAMTQSLRQQQQTGRRRVRGLAAVQSQAHRSGSLLSHTVPGTAMLQPQQLLMQAGVLTCTHLQQQQQQRVLKGSGEG